MRTLWRRVGLALWLTLMPVNPAHATPASPWLPGPNAAGDDTYAGFIDTPVSGSTITPNSTVVVQGWAVDQTAAGWSGIDDVQVFLGLQDQGGTLVAHGNVGVPRSDVAAALGNSAWLNSGFTVTFSEMGLATGPNLLTVYIHTPDKGSWYRQLQLTVPAAPDRAFADDPLLIVRTADPSQDVAQNTSQLLFTGFAIDRNMPLSLTLGVAGSGVSGVQSYLDGPRNPGANQGTFMGNATMGLKNREATGFGDRFLNSGWQITLHPRDLSIDRHELFIYAESAYWPNETLVIVPFSVH